jgi:hypothetical protein
LIAHAASGNSFHSRPFRRGTGNGLSRLGYAAGQIFWTHTDSGRTQFNYSEIGGNATAVAISSEYYPDGRNVGSAVSKFGSQIGVDMASNIYQLYEFIFSRFFMTLLFFFSFVASA